MDNTYKHDNWHLFRLQRLVDGKCHSEPPCCELANRMVCKFVNILFWISDGWSSITKFGKFRCKYKGLFIIYL